MAGLRAKLFQVAAGDDAHHEAPTQPKSTVQAFEGCQGRTEKR